MINAAIPLTTVIMSGRIPLNRHAFFFQAEDGIRVGRVTGVQTCALPISVPGQTDPVLTLYETRQILMVFHAPRRKSTEKMTVRSAQSAIMVIQIPESPSPARKASVQASGTRRPQTPRIPTTTGLRVSPAPRRPPP